VSIINIYRSAFDNSYDTIIVGTESTILETLPELDYENSLIYVNGFEVDEKYILKNGDICTIREFPAGKPGSSPFEIFLGIITLGIYTGIDAIVAGATGKTIGQWAKEGLLKWLAPDSSSTATNTADSLEGIPQLRGAKNQTNRNKPIPLVLGEHLYTPMYIGSPYTEIAGADGEDQYFNVLYLLGWGKLRVNELRLGPVNGLAKNPDNSNNPTDGKWSFNNNPAFFDPDYNPNAANPKLTFKYMDPTIAEGNPELEIRQGASEVSLYPQRVVEERLSIELMNAEGNSNMPIRFSAKNPQRVQVEITLNNGLIAYNDKGEKQNASVEIQVEWRGNPADPVWQEFGRFGTNGGLSPTSYNPNTHITTITRQKAKVMRFVAEKTFTFAQATAAVNRTLELRIQRASPKDPENNRIADTVFLTAIRTWCFDYEASQAVGTMVTQKPMIQKYRDQTARLGFRIKATDNLQGTIDALNCMVTSYARTWNGSVWSNTETPTSNPASIALKILQSPALGSNAYPDSMLDLDSFGEFYEWCAGREYTCNGVLTSEKRVDDLLHAVLYTGRGMRILNGNRYGVLIDKPRENPVTILNSQNVLEAKNQKNFEDLPDGFSIKFINKDDGYQETEIFVMADGSAQPGPASRIEAIEMPFVTDYKQVIKNGRYLLACRHLRPEVWIRKLSVDGYLVGIGNRVEVQDDTIVVGIGEGAAITSLIIENNTITEIQTDGVFDVVDMNKVYGIKIMQFDGINPGKVRTIQVSLPGPGIYKNFTVAISLASDPPLPQVGDIVSFGEYEKITTPALCFGKKANGDGTFEVTLIPYQEGIYTTDSGPIPPYEANITTPQGLSPAHSIPPDPATKNEVIETVHGMDLSGQAAVMYDLRPSVSVIKREDDGTITPEIISCTQVSIEGNNLPEPSNKIISYITSESNAVLLYTGPIQIGNWDWIDFILSEGGIELDRQRVPVLRSGRIILDIENQNYLLLCRRDGKPREDQIPFSIQATLYNGIKAVTDYFENNIISNKETIYFPVADEGFVDPFFNDTFYPMPPAIVWSLIGAPYGVTIDQNGLVTVAANYRINIINPNSEIVHYPADDGIADPMPEPFFPSLPESVWITGKTELEMRNEIKVQALYRGEIYTRMLRIVKIMEGAPGEQGKQGDPAPRYLGKTYNPGSNAGIVQIYDNPQSSRQVQANKGDYVAYVGTTSGLWVKGLCIRWNGSSWEQIPVVVDGNFESNPYVNALFDLTDGAPTGTFMNIFVRNLIAKSAMIEEIFAIIIQMSNNGIIKSQGFTGIDGSVLGFWLKAFDQVTGGGLIEANNAKFINTYLQGRIEAEEGFFRGLLETPSLRASTETVYSSIRSYSAGTTVQNVVNSEKTFWGNNTSNEWNKSIEVSGTFRGQPVSQFGFWDGGAGRPLQGYASITVIYSDGSIETLWDQTPLPDGGLSFQRITAGWNIQMRNLPISDPKIPNVIWRDGTTLKISVG